MKRAIANVSAALLLIVILAGWGQAQGSRRPTGREAYEAAKARERNMQNREMAMQHAGDDPSKKDTDERLKALSNQLKEDFRRMQVVNNDMMRAVAVDASLNYRTIVEATDEINKCARRLKTNLAAMDSGEERKQKKLDQLGPAELKGALFSLDELVMGFVTSLAVVDSQKQQQSSISLRDIIELSDHIKRNAERLDRGVQQQTSQKR